MNKELPKIFKCQQKQFDNNSSIFYGECRENKKKNVDDLFKINEIYRTKIQIKFQDKIEEHTIIGRTQNNLITLNNEIIPISKIIEINLI